MNIFLKAALATSISVAAPAAQAAITHLDIKDAVGFNDIGRSDDNTIVDAQLDPYSRIKGITYSVQLTSPNAIGGALVWFGSTSDAYVQFRPDRWNEEIGTVAYSGKINLSALDADFWLEDDGILRLQFADKWAAGDSTDDVTYHSTWNGWFDIDYDSPFAVPEPATWLTMVLGFAIVGAAMRRRRRFQAAGRGGLDPLACHNRESPMPGR